MLEAVVLAVAVESPIMRLEQLRGQEFLVREMRVGKV